MNDNCIFLDNVKLGENVFIGKMVNLYGCIIGDSSKVGAFVEIQKGVSIGSFCKISSHTFICEGVTIEDGVFIGHNVTFINDRYPRATSGDQKLKQETDWKLEKTIVRRGASIGSGATIMCGLEIGKGALVAAGSMVTKNVPEGATVAGNPAKIIKSK